MAGKPFNPRELMARIRAVLRRVAPIEPPSDDLVFGGLIVSFVRHEVLVAGQSVNLTPTEFRLLEVLIRQPGRAFSRRSCWIAPLAMIMKESNEPCMFM